MSSMLADDSFYWWETENATRAQATDNKGNPNSAKPTVIGLYGVSGCGKTTLLNGLSADLGQDKFAFYDGSAMIEEVVPGGLAAFKAMNDSDKTKYRGQAIEAIGKQCSDNGKVGIVAGHLMLWDSADQKEPQPIYTDLDFTTYTHIIYLDVSAKEVAKWRGDDASKKRASLTEAQLKRWQLEEIVVLRKLCLQHKICFMNLVLTEADVLTLHGVCQKVLTLFDYLLSESEIRNLSLAERSLDKDFGSCGSKTTLVFDADKTLTEQDTGALFWEAFDQKIPIPMSFLAWVVSDEIMPLSVADIFQNMGHTYAAFRQAMLWYEEVDKQRYESLCEKVASSVVMYPRMLSLLQLVAEHSNVTVVVVTSGLKAVWERVLDQEGLSFKVIGGGRLSNEYVVTPEIKTALVKRLQDVHKQYVWAFGDSPLDLGMLKQADRAVVIAGSMETRSKSMEEHLSTAIDDGLKAHQVRLPNTVPARLDIERLPELDLTKKDFVDQILQHAKHKTSFSNLEPYLAKSTIAAILATGLRDATISGTELREVHRRVGWYLATEFFGEILGHNKHDILHVNDKLTDGYCIRHQDKTLVVALMRGGEPMAFGVSDAMPGAAFLHAKEPKDVGKRHLEGRRTVVLVDSVINTGKSILEFMEHIRKIHATIRVVIVAGVVQQEFISDGKLNSYSNTRLVALRKSKAKYKGVGGTDTGHRLFNTTYLEPEETEKEQEAVKEKANTVIRIHRTIS